MRGQESAMAGCTPPDWELFDVRNDPREIHNLYHDPKYAGLVKKRPPLPADRAAAAGQDRWGPMVDSGYG
jgi:hypothetical protein